MTESKYQHIIQLDRLLTAPEIEQLIKQYGLLRVKKAAQLELQSLREMIKANEDTGFDIADQEAEINYVTASLRCRLASEHAAKLQKVINATGIVLHTNLGRAVLPERALQNIAEVCSGYSNLEYDCSKGQRSSRNTYVEKQLCWLLGAERALVVNNCAAAVFLALKALCCGRKAIVSRGELVEIGGSFRLPDIMAASGAVLCEVGTTNKTYVKDYVDKLSDDTGVIMKVHRSNFTMLGFTQAASVRELAAVKQNVPLLTDLGSGICDKTLSYLLSREPNVRQVWRDGSDLVTFSGDKLLGGVQVGIIIGKKSYIDILEHNPLYRILRPDKILLAALEEILEIYLQEKTASDLPLVKMLTADCDILQQQNQKIVDIFAKAGIKATTVKEMTAVGGGSSPDTKLLTPVVAVDMPAVKLVELERKLKQAKIPIICYLQNGRLLFNLRTVAAADMAILQQELREILA